jgi:hypothetical protein
LFVSDFSQNYMGLALLEARRRPVVSVLFPVAAQFLAGGKKLAFTSAQVLAEG